MVMEDEHRAVWVSGDAELEDEWDLLEEAYLDGRRGQLVSYGSVEGVSVSATAETLENAGLSDGDYQLISKTGQPDQGLGLLRSTPAEVRVRTVHETGYGAELPLEGEQKSRT